MPNKIGDGVFYLSCAGTFPRPTPVVFSAPTTRTEAGQAVSRSKNGRGHAVILRGETAGESKGGTPLAHILPEAKYSVLCLPSG